MFPTLRTLTSRTTYRGSRGSGSGASSKTSARSSPFSKPTSLRAQLAGRTFKASQRGLYHGALLQSGHNVPNSRQKTARTWRPNVQKRNALWSDLLRQPIECKTTVRALRTMKKHGGLDGYIQTTDSARLGAFGRDLRDRMALAAKPRIRQQAKRAATEAFHRARQGLPPLSTPILTQPRTDRRARATPAPAPAPAPVSLTQAFNAATAAARTPLAAAKPGSALALLLPTPQQRRQRAAHGRRVKKHALRRPGVAALERRRVEAKEQRRAAWAAQQARGGQAAEGAAEVVTPAPTA